MNTRNPLEKENRELLRAVIDNLAEGVLIYDSDCKVITANPAAEAILGRSPAGNSWARVPPTAAAWASPLDPAAGPSTATRRWTPSPRGQSHRDVVRRRAAAGRQARVDIRQHGGGWTFPRPMEAGASSVRSWM